MFRPHDQQARRGMPESYAAELSADDRQGRQRVGNPL